MIVFPLNHVTFTECILSSAASQRQKTLDKLIYTIVRATQVQSSLVDNSKLLYGMLDISDGCPLDHEEVSNLLRKERPPHSHCIREEEAGLRKVEGCLLEYYSWMLLPVRKFFHAKIQALLLFDEVSL